MRLLHDYILKIGLILLVMIGFTSCHEQEEYSNDPYGNFDALWSIIDQNYCFFKDKDIDWQKVGIEYRAKVRPVMTERELFDVCEQMLELLKDGHTNLSSSWTTSFYRFWEQYPQNYDQRIVEQNYLNYNFQTSCGVKYMIISNNFGYIYYGDFSNSIGEGNIDNILSTVSSSDGLIIDVRDNGGGYLTNVEKLVRRFITERIFAGSISHKSGPGHDDFSTPYKYYFDPADNGRIKYLKPIVILTNRSSYSATNNFVSIMKFLPNVKIVGDSTGGGSGLPFTSELPNGWTIRFSACSITDPEGNVTEFGVAPSTGCKIDITNTDTFEGRDPILEKGFQILREMNGITAK